MSAICTHIDSIKVTALPHEIAGCADCLAIGGTWVHLRMCMSLRQDRLLRLLAEPARNTPRRRVRPPDHPLRRARRGLELVLPRQRRVRARPTMTLPELHLSDWRATKDTLHLYSPDRRQDPARDHAAAQPLVERPAVRRRSRSHDPAPASPRHDVRDHARLPRSRPGRRAPLTDAQGRSSSATDCPSPTSTPALHATLGELGVDVEIKEQPFGVPMTTPFAQDLEHAVLGPRRVERFGRILDWSDSVFEEFSGWFNGKTSPVHLFWHGLDLAVTRFSGRPARTARRRSRHPGGVLARGHLVRILARRRQRRRRRLLLLHGPGAPRTARPTARARLVDPVRLRARSAILPYEAVRTAARSKNDAARLLPERLRGRRPPRRLGHDQLRLELVPHSQPTPPTPSHRRRRLRPSGR